MTVSQVSSTIRSFGTNADQRLGKFKGLFGGSSTTESDESTEDMPPRPTASSKSSESSSSSSDDAAPSESADAKKEKKEEKKKVTGPVEIELPAHTRWTTIEPMTVEQKKAARDRYVLPAVFPTSLWC